MKSIREIYKIGRGPSSSHTMGPEKAARLFRSEHPEADAFKVILYGSLCRTGKGHGTDRVLMEVLSPIPTEIDFCHDAKEELPHPNTMDLIAYHSGEECARMRALSVGGGDIEVIGRPDTELPEVYPENSFAEVAEFCRFRTLDLAEYVFLTEDEGLRDFLTKVWHQMKATIREGLEAEGYLPGPLKVERKAKMLYNFGMEHEHAQTDECRLISAYAYATSEQNADCGTVVTAPTCGACGIVPATFYYLQKTRNLTDRQMVNGLAVAGLIGNIVKKNASISGAECGCQAEVGTATAMAAAGLDYLFGLSMDQTQFAAEIALEHQLGLTCDPILGLVQVPCIERNAVAAMRAMTCASLSFFLSDTQRISFDIAVKTMYETGKSMNRRFLETSEGGLAKMYGRRNCIDPDSGS